MVAEREGETVRSERISSLIAVAKARVWASEGWQVTITNADGKVFGQSEFDELLLLGRPAKPKDAETKLAPEMDATLVPETKISVPEINVPAAVATNASVQEADAMAGV
jgi:hypothetical protein